MTAALLCFLGCTPSWSHPVVGPVNFCGGAMFYDLLVKVSVTGAATTSQLALDFSPQERWFSKLPARVIRSEWEQSPTELSIVTPADATKGEVLGVAFEKREVWVFLRSAHSTQSDAPLYFAGLGDLGSVQQDGSVRFPGGTFGSEEELLYRAKLARENPDCAFKKDLVVTSN